MSETAEIQDEGQKVPIKINRLRWSDLSQRRGRFLIAQTMLVDNCDAVAAIMGECIVTRCEHNWGMDYFEYDALSWQFFEVPEGQMPPEYVWEKSRNDIWAARKTEVTQ